MSNNTAKPTLCGENLAELMLQARKISGLSQAQVAAILNRMGEDAGPGSVGRAETGEGPRNVSKARREAAARGFRLSFVLEPLGQEPDETTEMDETALMVRRLENTVRAAAEHMRAMQAQMDELQLEIARRDAMAPRSRASTQSGVSVVFVKDEEHD